MSILCTNGGYHEPKKLFLFSLCVLIRQRHSLGLQKEKGVEKGDGERDL